MLSIYNYIHGTVILLPAHPASFAHKFYFSDSQRVPGCSSIADLSLKIVFWTHKSLQLGLIDIIGRSESQDP